MNSKEAGHRGVRDAQRIFLNLGAWEMPFVTQKSLEFVSEEFALDGRLGERLSTDLTSSHLLLRF